MPPETSRTESARRPAATTVLNIALVVAAILAFVVLASRGPAGPGIEVLRGDPPPGLDEMRVHVQGAVAAPGVVLVQPGDRVEDALRLAGGPLPEADLAAVNLALRLQDQDMVHLPREGEAAALALVDINTAGQRELETLPQIGPARAQAIIEGRPYASTEDLEERRVIPPNAYDQIRTLITAR